jgi:putative ABC transport system ATP-binding protein
MICLQRVWRSYGTGPDVVPALRNVDLTVRRGEYVAVTGPSGSGKSTLLNILGCLDAPTSGRYLIDGRDVRTLDEAQLRFIRNRRVGFVFQALHLVPGASAFDNVEMPLIYAGVRLGPRRERVRQALDGVGLADRADRLPRQLSLGEQQRVAVARALVAGPSLLLADEPTVASDPADTDRVLDLFDRFVASGRSIVAVTHQQRIVARAGRLVTLQDGAIIADTPVNAGATADVRIPGPRRAVTAAPVSTN